MSTIVTLLHIQLQKLDALLNQGDITMASIAELVAAQAQQTSTMQEIASDVADLLTKETSMAQDLQSLRDQMAAGGGITPADLDPILATMQSQQATLQQIAASVPPPATP